MYWFKSKESHCNLLNCFEYISCTCHFRWSLGTAATLGDKWILCGKWDTPVPPQITRSAIFACNNGRTATGGKKEEGAGRNWWSAFMSAVFDIQSILLVFWGHCSYLDNLLLSFPLNFFLLCLKLHVDKIWHSSVSRKQRVQY